jgi:cytochrome c-type biogenesis protein CcmH
VSRRAAAAVLALILIATASTATATAIAATPKASLTDIENDVMCVSCREPLAVAESPQAYSERAYIRHLIDQGMSKRQIEQALVAQYGPAVLGKPPASGFNLTVYVLPPAILALGIAALAITLPRWRRRTRAARPTTAAEGPALDPIDARRLEDELARYDG